MIPVWIAHALLLNSPLVGRAVRHHDWMPGVTSSSFDDIGALALEIGSDTVRCYGDGAWPWAQVGVQGFTSGSRPLVRDVADRLASDVGAPIVTVRTGFGTPGPTCLEAPFFPVWADIPWMNFDLDNWVSADIVAAAPELRSARIPACYEAVESERGLWWIYRDDPARVTTEEVTALWEAVYPGLMHGGEARRAVPQKLRPARKGAGVASRIEVKSTQTIVRLIVSVNPKSKTPLVLFTAAVFEWANQVEFYKASDVPAERKSEVCFSMDLGNENAPNPDNGSSEFAALLVLLQAVGTGDEVVHAEIVNA